MKRFFILAVFAGFVFGGCNGQSASQSASQTQGEVARMGSISGGGADQLSYQQNYAWFLFHADRKIHYCIDLSPSFGLSLASAQFQIEEAFQTWKTYFEQKQIYLPTGAPAADLQALETETEFQASCDGSEDLKFYLGTESAEVDATKGYFSNPYAFAVPTQYDPASRWGKGFIWFGLPAGGDSGRPSQWAEGTFLPILLHELGHMYGCNHVEDTVMSAEIAELVVDSFDAPIHSIDLNNELVLKVLGTTTYVDNGSPQEFFRDYFGIPFSSNQEPPPGSSLALTLSHGSTGTEFSGVMSYFGHDFVIGNLTPIDETSAIDDDQVTVFNENLPDGEWKIGYGTLRQIFAGEISNGSGKSEPIVLIRNIGEYQVQITSTTEDGKTTMLFDGNHPEPSPLLAPVPSSAPSSVPSPGPSAYPSSFPSSVPSVAPSWNPSLNP